MRVIFSVGYSFLRFARLSRLVTACDYRGFQMALDLPIYKSAGGDEMQHSKITRSSRRGLRGFLIVLIGFLLIGAGGVPAHALRERARDSSDNSRRDYERLQRIMIPLIRASNQSRRANQISVRIVNEPSINAGSAGGGEFLVTTGLLGRANDDQLRGILAHEIAHDDLGHPAKMQVLGVGLNLGAVLLEKLIPGSGNFAPIAGNLIASSYSRPQELEADRHAVTILRRAGYDKNVMIRSLNWIMRVEGNSGGGLLSTHPATDERIRALRQL
jgi:predicted Zn-dependent protease